MGTMILSGDIGGTNTRLCLNNANQCTIPLFQKNYPSQAYPSLTAILQTFLHDIKDITTTIASACIAVAGPVQNDVIKLTNLSWQFSSDEIKKALQTDKVNIINDFAAIGYGLNTLNSNDVVTIQQGKPKSDALKTIVGAGTGLGVAHVHNSNNNYWVFPSEAGHINFAPTNELELELLQYLWKTRESISAERLISGPGLVTIYQFLINRTVHREAECLTLLDSQKDKAAFITQLAYQQQAPIATEAVNLFFSLYATFAGNIALTSLPFGGLYIAGGIASKCMQHMCYQTFTKCFSNKGRMSIVVEKIPIHIIVNTKVGLQGATWLAKQSL